MSIIFDRQKCEIIDTRCHENPLFMGKISVCYTLTCDDITTGKKPSATPYNDRTDAFEMRDGVLFGTETKTSVRVYEYLDGICLDMHCDGEDISELGLNLPFNFMGKIGGGDWSGQLLFNSPYRSPDGKITYAFLTRPNGKNVLVAILSQADGWKMDYSPYLWAHYFVNLKMLASFDRAYNTKSTNRDMKVVILPVDDFDSALAKLEDCYGVPFIRASVSGGKIGDTVSIIASSEPDFIIERSVSGERKLPFAKNYTVSNEGDIELIPVKDGKSGAPITLYGFSSFEELYKKSMDSVNLETIKKYTDGNLCEHQCWASAMLRFLRKYKNMLSPSEVCEYEGKVRSFLDILIEGDIEKATPRQTIMKTPHDTFGAYNVFKSRRVQELYHGITILRDAYLYFGDEKYYEYVIGATDCLLRDYQKESGAIEIDWGNGSIEDYSSVCCPVIPIVDVANLISDTDKERSERYFESAKRLCEHLYKRGMRFPTEGGETREAQEEMEDGSMSCTALGLLYYCANAKREERYIDKAKEILSAHNAWIIHTPIAQMQGSTLRWWETQWEGDADGPAICAGHAWSIWRGEADHLLYSLTGDEDALLRARNTFMTNLSKIREDGTTYSIYNPDLINGGGFHSTSDEIRFRVAPSFADTEDCGISRYVWIRAFECGIWNAECGMKKSK